MKQAVYLQRIVPCLLRWFPEHGRTLPWRERPLPYYVWISEIMLQQTRIDTVLPYFRRFTERLPSVAELAACPDEELMKLWEGLGYYSRVRNLKKAACVVMDRYGGQVPADYSLLVRLPGIGNYTAAAISSIAFGRPEAAVDGNVLRVVSRITDDDRCIDDLKVRRDWQNTLREVILQAEKEQSASGGNLPGTFNQAMMELGERVCLPGKEPDCGGCPVSSFCLAKESGRKMLLPVRKEKKPRRTEERTVLVVWDGSRTVLRKRESKGLLSGMWELPNFDGYLSPDQALDEVRKIGLCPVRIRPLSSARHIFSHIEWRMKGYLVLTEETGRDEEEVRFLRDEKSRDLILVKPEKAGRKYAVPTAFSAYTGVLGMKSGNKKAGEPFEETV